MDKSKAIPTSIPTSKSQLWMTIHGFLLGLERFAEADFVSIEILRLEWERVRRQSTWSGSGGNVCGPSLPQLSPTTLVLMLPSGAR